MNGHGFTDRHPRGVEEGVRASATRRVIRRKYDKCARIRRGFKLCFFAGVVLLVSLSEFPTSVDRRGLRRHRRRDRCFRALTVRFGLFLGYFSVLFGSGPARPWQQHTYPWYCVRGLCGGA